MTRLVVGLAFSHDGRDVLLIQKKRPAEFAGKWAGVGGHVEQGETFLEGMHREAREEAGIDIPWNHFVTEAVNDRAEVRFYRSFTDKIYKAETLTDETVGIARVSLALLRAHRVGRQLVRDLYWIIPLALDIETAVTAPVVVEKVLG